MSKKINSKIQALEKKMSKDKAALAKLRQKADKKKIANYSLQVGKKKTTLLELFGDKNEMILIHNMGFSCAYCTLWADGFNGLVKPLQDRAAFVIENEESPDTQAKFAKSRGWKMKLATSRDTTLKRDLGFQEKNGDNSPGISALVRDNKGNIYQVAHTYLGPGDNYCVMWDLCDLLPPSDWAPQFRY